jgi:hypothetical protein
MRLSTGRIRRLQAHEEEIVCDLPTIVCGGDISRLARFQALNFGNLGSGDVCFMLVNRVRIGAEA